jgi:hypothetical protein
VNLILLRPILLPGLGVGALVPGDVGRAQREPRQVHERPTAAQRRAHVQWDELWPKHHYITQIRHHFEVNYVRLPVIQQYTNKMIYAYSFVFPQAL